jgi:protein-tyrosine phosphatase
MREYKCLHGHKGAIVYCSGGSGRTGHVLAAWLVYGHNMTNKAAIDPVIASSIDPYEAEGWNSKGSNERKRD